MRVDSEQLPQHLGRGLRPLYTVHGEELLLALEAADRIRACCREHGYSEREILSVESGFDWSQLIYSGRSPSLFGSRRLIELRIPSGKPGVEGADALKRYTADLPPDTITLVCLPKLERATLAAAWFEALEAAGVAVEANAVGLGRLPAWLAGRLALQDQRADEQALRFLAARVEGNLLAAHQEVQKLSLLFGPGALSFEQIKDVVLDVTRYDVFELGEALLGGDAPRFVRMLEGLEGEGVAAPLVLWAMVEEVRALLRVLHALEQRQPMAAALRNARVWGRRAQLLPRAVTRFSVPALHRLLLRAAEIDRMIKGIAHGEVWDELLRIGLAICLQPASGGEVNRGRIRRSIATG